VIKGLLISAATLVCAEPHNKRMKLTSLSAAPGQMEAPPRASLAEWTGAPARSLSAVLGGPEPHV
jgi:hypothetical protein